MENFRMYNPTNVFFGKDVVNKLGKTIEDYGKKVLFIYGKGSIKRNGIYDQVMKQLEGAGMEVFEYSGIKSNPVIEDVDAASALGREKEIDVILAVGGGSVIDSAKITSITIPVKHSGWDFMVGKEKPQEAVPLLTVLTLAATGTEMNQFAVVQNKELNKKLGFGSSLVYPRHSFLDPSYTISVSAGYTAFGIADLIAHALEIWFGEGDAPLSDRFILAIIREAMEAGPLLMNDLKNYELRARIMYAATSALNGFTAYGKSKGDWGVHGFGHVLSVLYDIPHGASLSIVYPAWLKIIKNRDPERIAELSEGLFGSSDPDAGIRYLENFFKRIGCPVRLADHIEGDQDKYEMIHVMKENQANGAVYHLDDNEIEAMVDNFME